MKFKFIGEDGSMGLRRGAVYEIRSFVQQDLLWITWDGNHCPYRNLESFLKNWEKVDTDV